MEFKAGDKVILIHTGEKGSIVEVDNKGMANVMLQSSGITIPVMIEDLSSPDAVQTSKLEQPTIPQKTDEDTQKKLPSEMLVGKGILLQIETDKDMQQFQLGLVNDTGYPFVCTIHIDFDNEHWPAQSFRIVSGHIRKLGEIPRDHLNERPQIKAEMIRFSTKGEEDRHVEELKIKPKSLFNRLEESSQNRLQANFVLLSSQAWVEQENKEDLRQYTLRQSTRSDHHWDSELDQIEIDPEEWAHFDNVIDLHIEKLVAEHQSLNNAEKLRIQLAEFDRFLEKAIRIGVDSIFVIHGIGKGKLRNAIASRVMKHPHVRTFRNEFHPKFGFGATEILF